MDISTLDWGSVPDYLAVFGIIGAIIVGVRTWRKERREEREKDIRLSEERSTGVALVVADCTWPYRSESGRNTSLACNVKTLGGVPVMDVVLTVRYIGTSELVPPDLRELQFESSVVTSEKPFHATVEYTKWPLIDYTAKDFTWELEFSDIYGKRWKRLPKGRPVEIG